MGKIVLIVKIVYILYTIVRTIGTAIQKRSLKNTILFMALFVMVFIDIRRLILNPSVDPLSETMALIMVVYVTVIFFNHARTQNILFGSASDYQVQLLSEIIENVEEGIAIIGVHDLEIIAMNETFRHFMSNNAQFTTLHEIISRYNRGDTEIELKGYENDTLYYRILLTDIGNGRVRIHITDITNQRRKEIRLETELTLFRQVFKRGGIARIVFQTDLEVWQYNEQFYKLFKIDTQKRLNKAFLRLEIPELYSIVDQMKYDLENTGGLQLVAEKQMLIKDRIKYLDFKLDKIANEKVTYYSLSCTDRTEYYRLRSRLNVMHSLAMEIEGTPLLEDVYYDLIADKPYYIGVNLSETRREDAQKMASNPEFKDADHVLFEEIKHSTEDERFLNFEIGNMPYVIYRINRDDYGKAVGIVLRMPDYVRRYLKLEDVGKHILPHVRDSIIVLNSEGNMIYVNDVLVRLLGFEREALIGEAFNHIKKGVPLEYALLQKAREQTVHFEIELYAKEGNTIPVDLIGRYVATNLSGHYILLLRDTLERNQYKEWFLDSQTKYEQIINTLQDGIIEISLPERHVSLIQAISMNRQFVGNEYPFYEWIDHIHEEDRGRVIESIDIITSEKSQRYYFEYRFLTNGEWVWTRSAGNYIVGEKSDFILLVNHNINQIRSMEAELQENRFILRETEKITAMAHWKYNFVSNSFDVSENFSEVLKLRNMTQSISFEALIEHVHPSDRQYVKEKFLDMIWKQGRLDIIYRIIRHGEVRFVQIVGEVYYEDNVPQYALGNIADVTEKINIESKLQNSQKMLNTIIDQSPAGIIVVKRLGRIEIINPTAVALLGIEEGANLTTVMLKNHLETHFETYENGEIKLIVNQLLSDRDHKVLIRNDLQILQLISTPMLDEEGRYTGNILIFIDMTEREHLYEQYRTEVEKVVEAEHMAQMAHFEFLADFVDLECSSTFLDIIEAETMIPMSKTLLFDLIDTADHQRIKEEIEMLRTQLGKVELEFDLVTLKGNVKHVLVNINRSMRGDDFFYQGTIQDISVLYFALERAKRSEQEKASILSSVEDQITYYDIEHNIIDYNHTNLRPTLLKTDLRGVNCKLAYYPDEKSCISCAVRVVTDSHAPHKQEYFDHDKWFEQSAYPVFDDEVKLIGIVEIIRDITKDKIIKVHEVELDRYVQFERNALIICDEIRNIMQSIASYHDHIEGRHNEIFRKAYSGIEVSLKILEESTSELKVLNLREHP